MSIMQYVESRRVDYTTKIERRRLKTVHTNDRPSKRVTQYTEQLCALCSYLACTHQHNQGNFIYPEVMNYFLMFR